MKARSPTSLRSRGSQALTHNSNRIAIYLQAIALLNLPNLWLAGGAVAKYCLAIALWQ
ncbi:hypothetical protein AVDCRST_MAG94-647 [uncultured Leptolyngbya sp.]|uniref:Uncharacterized protein n=1 Tax=uncultured Leptolyngbya sp. TaxID=332963 RepID=A0A6J4KGN2_9CYAN|nr:hypothetical protein AVDCRST_MAG94-647 [uncultured Leptolyngbya sp.]